MPSKLATFLHGKQLLMHGVSVQDLPEPRTPAEKETKEKLSKGEFMLVPNGGVLLVIYDKGQFNSRQHAKDTFIQKANEPDKA